MNLAALTFLAPALSLSAFSFILFGIDAAANDVRGPLRRASFWVVLTGFLVTAFLLPVVVPEAPVVYGRRMLVWDGLAYFMAWVALLTGSIVVLMSERYRAFDGLRLAAYYGLLLISTVGILFVAAANDFLMIFLAIEMVGIPSFILTGYLRKDPKATEGAIKFFLLGAFSSAMLAYGISIVYGLTGTTSLSLIHEQLPALKDHASLAMLAAILVLVSFGFKIALVPFHMWVPDAFEGAPLPIAAYLSVAPKIAGVAVALRVFGLATAFHPGLIEVLAVLAAVTMTVGNIVGLQQTNVVRLLAYSSIAHMGYILLGVVAGSAMGISSVFLYGWVYLFMNLGAFAVVGTLANAIGSTDLSAFAGLSKRSPVLSGLLLLFIISLAGLPPTAGFVAKFYVFAAALKSGWIWLVVVAAANSVISVAYYFKILHAMYFRAPQSENPVDISVSSRLTLAVTSFFTLLIGIYPAVSLARMDWLAADNPPAATTPAGEAVSQPSATPVSEVPDTLTHTS